MKRLHDLLPAPAWMLPRLSQNAEEKTWTCLTCGVVPPIALADGWYTRRLCRCERAAFASVVSLFDALQERIQAGQDYHELVRKAIETPLLVLDDLDKLKPSEFREETLYKLLNGRSVAGLPLALSSNNAPDALVRWIGEAGRSRLMAGLIPVLMNGQDYRLAG